MKPLIIIPARGGSKGIPRKNVKLLGGRPLIGYTIAVADAVSAQLGGAVVLSTDDDEIATVARSLGLTVDYMRPAHLGGDHVGSREVMLDVMAWADARGMSYDCVILLQPTSPLRTEADVLGTAALYTPEIDMAVSVCESAANPYYTLFETDAEGFLHISKGDGLFKRRQDVPKVLEYNGAVYVINPASLRRMELGEFTRRVPYEMPRSRSLDLDTPDDWLLAEMIVARLKESEL